MAQAVQVKAGSLKFRKTVQNEQLCNKLTVENWIFTEYVASEKYRSVLDACHQGKLGQPTETNMGTLFKQTSAALSALIY